MEYIHPKQAENVRKAYREGRGLQYCRPELVTLTRRATCRLCGEQITKGRQALKWAHSYTSHSSYTAVNSFIHPEECPSPPKNTSLLVGEGTGR